MPKHKSKRKDEDGSDNSTSDSGPEDRIPVKKPKQQETKSTNSKSSNEDDKTWELGKNRFIKLTEFKGKWYLDIREFYNNDGDLKPGRKGIMLTMEQWQKFKGCVDDIDEAIKKNV